MNLPAPCAHATTRVLRDEDGLWAPGEKPILICCGCGEEIIPLCRACFEAIGGAHAGPDAPYTQARDGEPCGAFDCRGDSA